MQGSWRDLPTVAVIVPVVGVLAVWVSRRVGRWFMTAVMNTFAETVSEAVAPDLARLAHRVGTSVDELRLANTADHTETGRRLGSVESRLTDVEARLASVESHLDIRPPDSRTRKEDTP